MRKQSIKAALKNPEIFRALNGLVGCPVGGWPETRQAESRIEDAIPTKDARSYTRNELIAAALKTDHAERYEWK